MKYPLLASSFKAASDTHLACGLALFFVALVGVWYRGSFHPRYQEMSALKQQATVLKKRLTLLRKRMQQGSCIAQQVSELQQSFSQQNLPHTLSEALSVFMSAIYRNKLRCTHYKNDHSKEHRHLVEQLLTCELLGSYEDLFLFIIADGVRCGGCTMSYRPEGVCLRGTFGIYAYQESSPKESL